MDERLTIQEVKSHAFFKDFDFDNIPCYEEFLSKGISKQERILWKIREYLIENEKSYADKEPNYLSDWKKFEDRIEQDEELKSDPLFMERIRLMKMQGRTMINHEENVFTWKEFLEKENP